MRLVQPIGRARARSRSGRSARCRAQVGRRGDVVGGVGERAPSSGSAARAASVETSSLGITRIGSTPSGGLRRAGTGMRAADGGCPSAIENGSGVRLPEARAGRRADGDAAVQRGGDVVGVTLDLAAACANSCSRPRPSSKRWSAASRPARIAAALEPRPRASGISLRTVKRRPSALCRRSKERTIRFDAVGRNRPVAGVDREAPSLGDLELEMQRQRRPEARRSRARGCPMRRAHGRCDRASSRVRTVQVGGAHRRDPRSAPGRAPGRIRRGRGVPRHGRPARPA